MLEVKKKKGVGMEGTLCQLRRIHIVAVSSSGGKYHYVTMTTLVVVSRPDEWTFSSDFLLSLSYLTQCLVLIVL